MITFPEWLKLNSSSVSGLTQLMLCLVITGILLRGRRKSSATWLLAGFFAATAGFTLSFFLALSVVLPWKNIPTLMQFQFLLLGLTALIQFAYHFPKPSPDQKKESRYALVVSILALAVGVFPTIAFIRSSRMSDLVMMMVMIALEFFWVIIVLFRRMRKLKDKPEGRGVRAFMFTVLSPLLLSVWAAVYYGITPKIVSFSVFAVVLNLGVLLFLFTFVMVYLNFAPEPSALMTKLILSVLVTVLVTIGILGHMATEIYDQDYCRGLMERARRIEAEYSATGHLPADASDGALYMISMPEEGKKITPYFIHSAGFNAKAVAGQGSMFKEGYSEKIPHISNIRQTGPRLENTFVACAFRKGGRVVEVGFSVEDYRKYIDERAMPIVVFLFIIMAVILLLIPRFFNPGLVRPLENLLKGVRRVNNGHFDVTVPVLYNDEIGFLTHSFNEMVASVRQADQLKDEFLANTSHELRTPLNGIIGIAESLLDGAAGEPTPEMRSNYIMIISSGKRLASLVNDILDFSKLKSHDLKLHRTPVDIRVISDVVLKLSEPLASGKPLVFKNEISPDIPAGYGDKDRLYQILHNLVANAIKFTDAGTVTVSASVDEAQNRLAVSVADTGIGIPEEEMENIFKSFEQLDASASREFSGTGLGLAVTRQLVELHDGEITVESEPGRGSVFTFTLPVSQEQPETVDDFFNLPSEEPETGSPFPADMKPAAAQPSLSPSLSKDTFNILVVDDEPVNQQVLANHLSLEKYSVTQAFTGEEALKIIGGGSRFDMILLDIMMPRMSGYEVCQKIREIFLPSELPVIMITAKNQVSDMVTGFTSGANDYLAKPFSKQELLARIQTHLHLLNINTAYGRFVPFEFLRTLGKESILDVRLGDQVQGEMTVLFSDIRSFTTISESMTPKENFDFLNAFLRKMIPSIRKNHGFIDKYVGDAVMAIFPRKSEDALMGGLDMLKQLEAFNREQQASGGLPIRIGIGIHTGTLMMGTIGDEQRMDSTVISDAVNLASRLEGLTKTYGASLLISGSAFEAVEAPEKYAVRSLGKVQVKGKKDAVAIFEIYDGDSSRIRALKEQTLPDFEAGQRLYFSRKFTEAAALFEKVIRLNPEDKAAQLYLQHLAQFMAHGVPDDWQGVETMNHK